jgi:hypothetical protein
MTKTFGPPVVWAWLLLMSPSVAEPPQLSPLVEAPLVLAVIVVVALVEQFQVGERAKFHELASILTEGGKFRWVQPSAEASRGEFGAVSPLASETPPPHTPLWQVALLAQL